MEKMNGFLRIGDAAKLLGVCSSTLRSWERNEKIKPYRHAQNSYRYYRKEDIEMLLKEIHNFHLGIYMKKEATLPKSRLAIQDPSSFGEYQAWNNMVYALTCEKDERYQQYKDQGITMCERWKDASNFLYDMGKRPNGYVLGRIDCNKGFYPENCAWMTRSQNFQNLKKAKREREEKEATALAKQAIAEEKAQKQEEPKRVYVPEELALKHINNMEKLLDLAVQYHDQKEELKKKIFALDSLIHRVNELNKLQKKEIISDSSMFNFLENL